MSMISPAMEQPTLTPIVRRVVLGFVATSIGLVMPLVLADRPAWWRGYLAATLISAAAAGISLLPLLWGINRKLDHLVAGSFVAAGLRMVICLGGCLLAVYVGRYPPAPTFLLMLGYYVVLLSVETFIVASAAWSRKA